MHLASPLRPLALWLACLLLCAANLLAQRTPPPPLFGPGERILFTGDSITDMGRGRGEDPNHLLGHSYVFLIGARHGAAYPERQLRFLNRGISGNTLADLAARWTRDLQEARPDLLSVLIGINDVYFSFKNGKPLDVPALEATYDRLLIEARAQNPRLRLVLGEPFLLPGYNNQDQLQAWQAAVASLQAMTARLAARHQAALVPYQTAFNKALERAPVGHWIWDGIHPTQAGQQLMAEAWEKACLALVTPPYPDKTDNSALLPRPKLEQDSYDWYARHLEVLELQKTTKPEIVLIGDSITHFWAGEPRAGNRNGPLAWEHTFGRRTVLNLGFGWDRTQNVLWRLDHGQFDGLSPKLVVLNIGTNNLTGTANARTNTPAEIAEAIRLICLRLHAKSPATRLLVMGVLPRGFEPDASLRKPISELNRLLPEVLKNCPQVSFLDIGARFLQPDGSMPPELMPDSTHPSEKGYEIWGQALQESGLLPTP